MEPNLFRESRLSINRMYKRIDRLIEKKAVEESLSSLEKVEEDLAALRPKAEGEIQKRSVKNLKIRYKYLAARVRKLKTTRATSGTSGRSRKLPAIQWDEQRLSQLSKGYLEKLFDNMKGDPKAVVMLGTTGKGIRPNYQIQYNDGSVKGFTGSGHKVREVLAADGGKNLSPPFNLGVIEQVLNLS